MRVLSERLIPDVESINVDTILRVYRISYFKLDSHMTEPDERSPRLIRMVFEEVGDFNEEKAQYLAVWYYIRRVGIKHQYDNVDHFMDIKPDLRVIGINCDKII